MKVIKIYDSDREVLERLSEATGQKVPTLIGNLLKIGSQVFAKQILTTKSTSKGRRAAPQKTKRAASKHRGEMENGDLARAMAFAKSQGKVSISALQRGLGYGYNHAAHLLDLMLDKGLLEPGITKSSWNWKVALGERSKSCQ